MAHLLHFDGVYRSHYTLPLYTAAPPPSKNINNLKITRRYRMQREAYNGAQRTKKAYEKDIVNCNMGIMWSAYGKCSKYSYHQGLRYSRRC